MTSHPQHPACPHSFHKQYVKGYISISVTLKQKKGQILVALERGKAVRLFFRKARKAVTVGPQRKVSRLLMCSRTKKKTFNYSEISLQLIFYKYCDSLHLSCPSHSSCNDLSSPFPRPVCRLSRLSLWQFSANTLPQDLGSATGPGWHPVIIKGQPWE